MKTYKTLGPAADALFAMRSKRIDLEHQAETMKKVESELHDQILALMAKQGVEKASGKLCTVSRGDKPVARVHDWAKFYEWIRNHDAFDLLERRVAAGALEERVGAGQKVLGVELEHIKRLNVSKAGAR